MKRTTLAFLLLVLLLSACATPQAVTPSPAAAVGTPGDQPADSRWELVWADEFDGDALNPDNWLPETGGGGWGNHELQFYSDRPENLRLEDGSLVIEARREDYRGSDYTSARLKTQYLQAFQYGRVEARIKLPPGGKGIWPAFWMLGENITSAGWPRCGEIDIMESIGDPHTIYGTLHGPGYSGGDGIGRPYVAAATLSDDFHIYAIEWGPDEIRWYLDDANYLTVSRDRVPGDWVYDQPFFILLNLAVGGDWPGVPDERTVFPQQLLVDYVRVYRDTQLVLPESAGTLHVAALEMTFSEQDGRQFASVRVKVVDAAGNPVRGAQVRGGWTGATANSDWQAATDGSGMAGPLRGRVVSSAQTVTFCVIGIAHPDYEYDKKANAQTCIEAAP
ncbi:MAG: hypothetical protein Fur0018_27940 [Anaerolineales bacterium]